LAQPVGYRGLPRELKLLRPWEEYRP
jgi:hypothetical protein